MLQSFTDFQVFKQLILDYKLYYEKECEMESFTLRSKHNAIKMEGKK